MIFPGEKKEKKRGADKGGQKVHTPKKVQPRKNESYPGGQFA